MSNRIASARLSVRVVVRRLRFAGFLAVPRGRGDDGLSQDRLLSVHENPTTQAREGHLVNALVQRGDEGRSTLR